VALLPLLLACDNPRANAVGPDGSAGDASVIDGGGRPGGAAGDSGSTGEPVWLAGAGGLADTGAAGASEGGTSSGAFPAGGAGGDEGEGCELTYDEGHGDLFVVFDDGLDLSIRSTFGTDPSEILADTSRVCVIVPPASLALAQSMGGAPESSDYAFLGVSAGEPFWLLPATPRAGMPWFGASTEDVPAGRYAHDEVRVAITAVEMPEGGQVAAWSSSTFGVPSTIFSTATSSLAHSFPRGAHVHFNWAFSVAGTYTITFTVEGDRDGSPEVSPPSPLRFEVRQ